MFEAWIEARYAYRRDLVIAMRSARSDDLSAEQCLERYVANQRAEGAPPYQLTASQLTAARDLWSAQLRAKTEATAKVDRDRAVSVVAQTEED
ncbi:MAG: hypothetical protein ACTHU0_22180 [Kofleriaceae bacterium]